MTDKGDEHLEDLYRDLTTLLCQGKSPEAAYSELARDQERLFRSYPSLIAERLAALKRAHDSFLERQNNVRYLQKRAIRFGREQWYLGPANEDSLWTRLLGRLKECGRNDEEIELVDTDSNTVVGLLDNPVKTTFSTRGLVVGHVQSGKTGNIAAVINKAADTQYKYFLVFSGLTDQLRNQTQARLEKDVVSLAPDRWMTWTAVNTDQVNGDFSEKAIGGFSFDHRKQLAVVKKNAAILRRFLAKLRNTDEATLRNTPFLMIDDECDQASVNSARYATAITKINDLIRQILAKLPRAAYVGYTATPFANVLIDTTVPGDLYPRDFIHALRRPRAYFGAEELFGRHALDGDYDENIEGFDMIREVKSDEVGKLRPSNAKSSSVEINDSLKKAIRYYAMVIAARRVRGQSDRNNTMLVHTSVLNSIHRKTEAVVTPYVAELARRLKSVDSEFQNQLQQEWSNEQGRVLSEQFDRSPVEFARLLPHLSEVADSIKVHVENWTTVDRLDYSGSPTNYLVIGGNVLARGLTLDGLSVSYFLRSSSQYDTLMQMGRWFGYREGFEDLPRVWVEDGVRDLFFDLATIEAEIRRDIARYAEEEITPLEFAVRIRQIPGMAITAPAKMRSAVPVAIGYSGTHVQTFRFKRTDEKWLMNNWSAGARLIDAMPDGAIKSGRSHIFRKVPANLIIDFLLHYKPHETHKSLAPEFLPEFIKKGMGGDNRLSRWSVVIIGADGQPSSQKLGRLGIVPTVIRSAESGSGEDASIKALMSRKDILLDLEGKYGKPEDPSWERLKEIRENLKADAVLLLYPIEAQSKPRGSSKPGVKSPREPLDAKLDVLGYGIVFPGDKHLSGTYVSANITPDLSEPADELDEGDKIPDTLLDVTNSGGVA